MKKIDFTNEMFDLYAFHSNIYNDLKDGALIVITKDNIHKTILPEKTYHVNAMNQIMNEENIDKVYSDFSNYDWAYAAANDNNFIIIRLTDYFDFIYIPNEINDYQFQKLAKFNSELIKVNEQLKDYQVETIIYYENELGEFSNLSLELEKIANKNKKR